MYDSVKRAIENADANSAGRLCFVFSPQQISSCEMKKILIQFAGILSTRRV